METGCWGARFRVLYVENLSLLEIIHRETIEVGLYVFY